MKKKKAVQESLPDPFLNLITKLGKLRDYFPPDSEESTVLVEAMFAIGMLHLILEQKKEKPRPVQ